MRVFLIGLILSCMCPHLNARGTFRLYLKKFRNSNSYEQDQIPCDYFAGSCDTLFVIKLGSKGPPGSAGFPDKEIETEEYESQDNVNFGTKYNPISFPITTYKGYIYLYILVKDIDLIGYNTIDEYTLQLSTAKPGVMHGQTYRGKNRHTTLEIQFQWVCSTNYYGVKCDTYCVANDRYDCHTETGTRICKPGWMSNDCWTKDYCYTNPCQNEGICKNGYSGHTCHCVSGYHGTNCEKSPCISQPCMNGGQCHPAAQEQNYYICDCPQGVTGARCENVPIVDDPVTQKPNVSTVPPTVDPCAHKPCKNGGNCRASNDTRGFKCHCRDGFKGDVCETLVPICELKRPCENNGTCIGHNNSLTYDCQCTANYTGFHCGQLKCRTLCFNNGQCKKVDASYQCICTEKYTGFDCNVLAAMGVPLGFRDNRDAVTDEKKNNPYVLYIVLAALLTLIVTAVIVVVILEKRKVINLGDTYKRLRRNSMAFFDNYGRRPNENHVNVAYEAEVNNPVYDDIQGNNNEDHYYSTVQRKNPDCNQSRVVITIGPTTGQSETDSPYNEYNESQDCYSEPIDMEKENVTDGQKYSELDYGYDVPKSYPKSTKDDSDYDVLPNKEKWLDVDEYESENLNLTWKEVALSDTAAGGGNVYQEEDVTDFGELHAEHDLSDDIKNDFSIRYDK